MVPSFRTQAFFFGSVLCAGATALFAADDRVFPAIGSVVAATILLVFTIKSDWRDRP